MDKAIRPARVETERTYIFRQTTNYEVTATSAEEAWEKLSDEGGEEVDTNIEFKGIKE